jgi:hypothetical protein
VPPKTPDSISFHPGYSLHVSFEPNHDRQIVQMQPGKSGRLVPHVLPLEKFLRL